MARKLFIAIVTIVLAAVLVIPALAGPGNSNRGGRSGDAPVAQQQDPPAEGNSTSQRGCYPPGRGTGKNNSRGKANC